LQERFTHLRGRAREGSRQRALFVVPPHNRWSPPVYEVALMFETWLRRERVRERVDIGFVTHEASFVEAAGPRMHEVIEREFSEPASKRTPPCGCSRRAPTRRRSPTAESTGSTCS
jgi:hypothetical protein